MSVSLSKEAAAEPSGPPTPLAGETPAVKNSRWLVFGVCVFLAAMVWVVFGQTLHHEFVNYDDDTYVYENPAVAPGLTFQGIVWAFTHVHSANWHPLTWISHMLDCQLYGLQAGGHHLTNVLLHTATVILLFLVLRRMTGLVWRSAFVAAVFAVHPLRVESVAWVAERKDVLSGLFFMLTLLCYTKAVTGDKWSAFATLRRGKQVTGTQTEAAPMFIMSPVTCHLSPFFWLALLFFTLGLMSKPMLVTLPLVLLLLDYWPLGRFTIDGSGNTPSLRLLLEKLPLFGLAGASCVVTIFAQHEAIQPFGSISLPLRMGNASIAYVAYMGQMFWPSGLAVLYPFPAAGIKVTEVVLSLVLLAGITTGVFVLRRRCPWMMTGWLWYLIMLVPVIGIVQVGYQTRADRYTYLPQIGLYVMLTWAAAELCAGWRHRRVVLGGLSTIILGGLILCAREQTTNWRNSESLWTHTLACTTDNFIADNDLGNMLLKMGRVDEAIVHYRKALEINPDCVEACYNLGDALLQKGRVDEAIAYCQKALQIMPDCAGAHGNLGNALLQKGRVDEAIAQYQKVLQIMPDSALAYNNLGSALLQKGSMDEAIAQYQTALQIKPDYAEAHDNLDCALLLKRKAEEALAQYQKALQINPDSVDVLNNLAWLLATSPDANIRDGVQAVKYAERACELTHHGVTVLVGTLAAAYAEAGRFDEAMAAAQKACALASASGELELLKRNQELLELYRAHQPYHEPAAKIAPGAPGSP